MLIDGRRVNDLPPHKRNVNTVFQNYALFPHMTVRENVGFGLQHGSALDGADATAARRASASSSSGSTGFARRLPAQLSGGQQQRVALARALVNRPAVLLLDEPLGALDLKLRQQMQIELARASSARSASTFVFVTHDQEEALSMADADRGHERRPRRAGRARRARSTTARRSRSWPTSSASPTSSRERSSREARGPMSAVEGGERDAPRRRATAERRR